MSNEGNVLLFTDGSVNPQSNIGFGAYLLLRADELNEPTHYDVKTKRFENTSSTKLELEALLWAFSQIQIESCTITVYTDCQNIIGLKNRRERFEKNDYFSKTHKRIKNHELYKEFFRVTDSLSCEFIKVKGHKEKNSKDDIDKIFTLVDKAARIALRDD